MIASRACGRTAPRRNGVSGDSSCADHNIAWRTRHALGLEHVPDGVSGDASGAGNIVYDITPQPGQMPGVRVGPVFRTGRSLLVMAR
jgi:hypothetical protein